MKREEQGFTILEVMIALTIISIVLVTTLTYLPSITITSDKTNLSYEAVNKVIDIEKKLIESTIVPVFSTGWKWEEDDGQFQTTVKYLNQATTDEHHHIFEIKVRWGSEWRTPGEIVTKTVIIDTMSEASP